jgi:hypothetical protein
LRSGWTASSNSGEHMSDLRWRQRRYLFLAMVFVVLLAPSSWLLAPEDLRLAGRWAALASGTAGLLCFYIASTLVPNEFEVEWSDVRPSDGRRGSDPAGWTEGRLDSELGMGRRRDDSSPSGEWDGMEGPLEPGERLRAEADDQHAALAAARWAAQEAADQELVEAGVERLGDLVAMGHFARTPDPGGVVRLMGKDEPKTP